MKNDPTQAPDAVDDAPSRALAELLAAPAASRSNDTPRTSIEGVQVGTLVALIDDGTNPLVVYAGQPQSAALRARATVDTTESHIGRSVLLVFEECDPFRPIIIGCLRDTGASIDDVPGHVEVDADGKRLTVSAREQMVLRCGKASITLTKAGKVIIEGAYVSTRSSGALRLKGGSVQIN